MKAPRPRAAGSVHENDPFAGIHTVGVSSGPDGEFIFTVSHDASVALRDVVPTLPGFAARVTGDADGVLTVTARDPESEN